MDAKEILHEIAKPVAAPMLVYCDAIAARIRYALLPRCDDAELIADVSRVEYDLHPDAGYLVSTKKTIRVTDRNGRKYKISVEEDV